MVDVTVTAANVLPSTAARHGSGTMAAGNTAARGRAGFKGSDGLLYLTDANNTALDELDFIFINDAGPGQKADYVEKDPDFNPGFTVTVGTIYVASATPGGIAPVADLVTGWRSLYVGSGKTSSTINLNPTEGGIVP